jgi:hypothetical protein
VLGKGVKPPPFFSFGIRACGQLDANLQRLYPKWFTSGDKKRTSYIKKDIDDLNKNWEDLIYDVCEGNAGEMNALRKFNIYDFFNYIDKKMKNG